MSVNGRGTQSTRTTLATASRYGGSGRYEFRRVAKFRMIVVLFGTCRPIWKGKGGRGLRGFSRTPLLNFKRFYTV